MVNRWPDNTMSKRNSLWWEPIMGKESHNNQADTLWTKLYMLDQIAVYFDILIWQVLQNGWIAL